MRDPLPWRFKRGLSPGEKKGLCSETISWITIIADEYQLHCMLAGEYLGPCVITNGWDPDSNSHSTGCAWDMRRRNVEDEEFARYVQKKYGRYVGVQLEPEWGKGIGYTAPHFHFQLKGPAIW